VPTLTMFGLFSECTRWVMAVPEVPTASVTPSVDAACGWYARRIAGELVVGQTRCRMPQQRADPPRRT